MMISKKEEERNEKIVRGLMKLPPNRRCINCDSLGPQYVCTNFWTFVCTTCSGIHREFTHRVKSVSMSKFTTQEVAALQKGGNQHAREQFLRKWDTYQMRLPANSNPEKIREFIKSVYVDKKYYRSTEKPPSDTSGEDDYRKSSSYHSFSQSPPYDHQYEERRYGKQAGTLGRKPGFERGHQGKITNFLYSPGRQGMQKFENKFANDSTGSRISDRSVSSDPFSYDGQSPDFYAHRIGPYSQGRPANAQKMDVAPQLVANGDSTKKSVSSSGDFGTAGCNSRLTKSESLIDPVLEAAPVSTTDAAKVDFFNHMPAQTENTFSAPFIDLFSDINQKPPIIPPVEEKPPVISANNGGWVVFDLHNILEPATQSTHVSPSIIKDAPKETIDLYSSVHSNFDWFSAQKSDSSGSSSLATDVWPVGLTGAKNSDGKGCAQLWNTLSDPIGSMTQPLPAVPLHNNESQDMLLCPPSYVDPCIRFRAPEVKLNDGYLIPSVDVKAPPAAGLTSSSFLPPSVSQTGGVPLEWKASSNPFDLEPEANNMFMDMSSLQATLPDPQLPAFSDSLSSSWFQQGSLLSFIPPVSQGSLAYTGGQLLSQYPQNITSQGSIPPLGGNPFV